MRFQKLALGVVGVGALTFGAAAGCGSSTNGNTGAGGTTSAHTSSAGTSMSTSTSTGTSGGCSPTAACKVVDKTCLGLTDNTGLTKFGLRIAELDVTKPTVLSMGSIAKTVGMAVTQNMAACQLKGTATFSWLLQFDTTAGTLKTGGAKPVTDPTMGYAFDMETVAGQTVTPITVMSKPDASGSFMTTMGMDLVVPIFLTADGTQFVLLPLKQARIVSGTLSSNNNCIGSYNASTLLTSNNCQPGTGMTQFTSGGKLDGHITLADADSVPISALQESLCVLLSGNPTMYGDGATPTAHCKKDASGKYLFQGDWCDATNMAGGCADSVQLTADFAANSVKITN